jgi:hypothetical protein
VTLVDISLDEFRALTPRQVFDLGVCRCIISEYGFGRVELAIIMPMDVYLEEMSRLAKAAELTGQLSELFGAKYGELLEALSPAPAVAGEEGK